MDVREKLVELLNEVQETGVNEIPAGFGCTCDYVKNEKVASHLIANGVTVQEWISVKDRLPETDDWVLVCRKTIKTGYTTIVVDRCTFTVGGDRMWLAEYATYKQVVTHWMQLPQPPKGE